MSGLDSGYRIYNTDPLKENAREGFSKINLSTETLKLKLIIVFSFH